MYEYLINAVKLHYNNRVRLQILFLGNRKIINSSAKKNHFRLTPKMELPPSEKILWGPEPDFFLYIKINF